MYCETIHFGKRREKGVRKCYSWELKCSQALRTPPLFTRNVSRKNGAMTTRKMFLMRTVPHQHMKFLREQCHINIFLPDKFVTRQCHISMFSPENSAMSTHHILARKVPHQHVHNFLVRMMPR